MPCLTPLVSHYYLHFPLFLPWVTVSNRGYFALGLPIRRECQRKQVSIHLSKTRTVFGQRMKWHSDARICLVSNFHLVLLQFYGELLQKVGNILKNNWKVLQIKFMCGSFPLINKAQFPRTEKLLTVMTLICWSKSFLHYQGPSIM